MPREKHKPTIGKSDKQTGVEITRDIARLRKKKRRPTSVAAKSQLLDEFIVELRRGGNEFDSDPDFGRRGVSAALTAIIRLMFLWTVITGEREDVSRSIIALSDAFDDLDRGIQSPLLTAKRDRGGDDADVKGRKGRPPTPTTELMFQAFVAFVADALIQEKIQSQEAFKLVAKKLENLKYPHRPNTIRDWRQVMNADSGILEDQPFDALFYEGLKKFWELHRQPNRGTGQAQRMLFAKLESYAKELRISDFNKLRSG